MPDPRQSPDGLISENRTSAGTFGKTESRRPFFFSTSAARDGSSVPRRTRPSAPLLAFTSLVGKTYPTVCVVFVSNNSKPKKKTRRNQKTGKAKLRGEEEGRGCVGMTEVAAPTVRCECRDCVRCLFFAARRTDAETHRRNAPQGPFGVQRPISCMSTSFGK